MKFFNNFYPVIEEKNRYYRSVKRKCFCFALKCTEMHWNALRGSHKIEVVLTGLATQSGTTGHNHHRFSKYYTDRNCPLFGMMFSVKYFRKHLIQYTTFPANYQEMVCENTRDTSSCVRSSSTCAHVNFMGLAPASFYACENPQSRYEIG